MRIFIVVACTDEYDHSVMGMQETTAFLDIQRERLLLKYRRRFLDHTYSKMQVVILSMDAATGAATVELNEVSEHPLKEVIAINQQAKSANSKVAKDWIAYEDYPEPAEEN